MHEAESMKPSYYRSSVGVQEVEGTRLHRHWRPNACYSIVVFVHTEEKEPRDEIGQWGPRGSHQ